jgi:hypothetical protein
VSLGTAQVIRANSRHLPLADNSVDLVVTSARPTSPSAATRTAASTTPARSVTSRRRRSSWGRCWR